MVSMKTIALVLVIALVGGIVYMTIDGAFEMGKVVANNITTYPFP